MTSDPSAGTTESDGRNDGHRRAARHLRWASVWGIVLVFGLPPLVGMLDLARSTTRIVLVIACVGVVGMMLLHTYLAHRRRRPTMSAPDVALGLRVRSQLVITGVLGAFAAGRIFAAWAPEELDGLVATISLLVLALGVVGAVVAFRLFSRALKIDPPQPRRPRRPDHTDAATST